MRTWVRIAAMVLMLGCTRTQMGRQAAAARGDGWVRSNIARADYAGSQTCASCHREIYERFIQGPMHNMTRLPADVPAGPPFDGRVFHFKDDSVVLEESQGRRWMRIRSPRFGSHDFRVTKVIGGHHREDFAGVEEGQADPHAERILPVSYMMATGKLRYKGYSVMDPERPGLKAGAVWNQTCLFCHNTVPYLSSLMGELAPPGTAPYQGETVDRLLPSSRRRSFQVTDTGALRQALSQEIAFLRGAPLAAGAGPREAVKRAIAATRKNFNETHLLEVGIGCESCHGGSLEHARDPRVRPSLEPRSPFMKVALPQGGDARARRIDEVCARCHQVLFTGYPWTWEGAARSGSEPGGADAPGGAGAPGGAHINSGEGRDLLLSNCQVTCVDCHDPHAHDDRQSLARFETRAGNETCLRCHGSLAAPEALRAHAHHDPAGAGGLCLNCHMPRKNMSLDTRLSRYHRIGSPTDKARVEGDRPLECALCHADKAVGTLVDSMETWWGHSYDRKALEALYGDTAANAIEATLRLGKPHEQATALYLAGRTRDARLARTVARQLANPYPLVRYYADDALAEISGGPSPLDLHQDNEKIARAAAEWLQGFAPAQ